VDKKGTITAVNSEAARMLRVDPNRILSGKIEEAAGKHHGFRTFEDIFCDPVSQAREYGYLGEDGLQHSVEVTVSPLKDNSGDEAGTLFFFKDETEKNRIAEQIRRMSKLAAVGQLAAGISHEIRNPMMGIAATMELISDGMAPDHPQRRLLMKSMEEIGRIDNVIGELLSLAQPREMHPEPADINQLISDVADFLSGLCRKKQIQLLLHPDPRLSIVSVDRKAMREVIINVALNSIQSMKETGALKIETTSLDRRLYNMDQGSVKITIEDTGEGIPTEIRDKIFDPFFTTRPDGTGLGLSNCHRIIEAHDGAIFIEDAPVRGTRVYILLPAAPARGTG
jgi:signal transduction histidine kinase